MENKKHTLKQVQAHFNFSRSTLYKILKKQCISTYKEGRIAYISDTDFTHLKTHVFSKKKYESIHTSKNTDSQTAYLQKKLEEEQRKNEQLQKENQSLVREVGQWEGVARTLQDQNQKLLTLHPAKPQKWGFFQSIFSKK